MSIELIIGSIAGILGVSGFTWQTWKNPIGMTYPMIIFIGTSLSLWAGYGFLTGDSIIYLPNSIMIGLLGVTITKKVRK